MLSINDDTINKDIVATLNDIESKYGIKINKLVALEKGEYNYDLDIDYKTLSEDELEDKNYADFMVTVTRYNLSADGYNKPFLTKDKENVKIVGISSLLTDYPFLVNKLDTNEQGLFSIEAYNSYFPKI